MAKSRTHFEQIPVEAVKKIIEELSREKPDTEDDNRRVERAHQKLEPYSVTNLHFGN